MRLHLPSQCASDLIDVVAEEVAEVQGLTARLVGRQGTL
jgi:hypothetical protein